MNLSAFEPMSITEGPPLPKFLDPYLPFKGYWPWLSPATGNLQVTVLDKSTGKLLPGVTVGVNGQTTTTNSRGFCSFSLTAGPYTVTLSMNGYTTQTFQVNAPVVPATYALEVSLVPIS